MRVATDQKRKLLFVNVVQCPLGFATLGKAVALALATSRALTDLRQYINSDLGFSDLNMWKKALRIVPAHYLYPDAYYTNTLALATTTVAIYCIKKQILRSLNPRSLFMY